MRGNVVDLAVAVVTGSDFGKAVKAINTLKRKEDAPPPAPAAPPEDILRIARLTVAIANLLAMAQATPYYNPASHTGLTTDHELFRTIGCPGHAILAHPARRPRRLSLRRRRRIRPPSQNPTATATAWSTDSTAAPTHPPAPRSTSMAVPNR